MILAWSMTEVIRYPFYAFSLLGKVPYPFLWLRYTTFYVLYPIGVFSEAVSIYATLPISSPATWKTYDFVRALLFVIWWICKISNFIFCSYTEINSRSICTIHIYDQATTKSSWKRKDGQKGIDHVCIASYLHALRSH